MRIRHQLHASNPIPVSGQRTRGGRILTAPHELHQIGGENSNKVTRVNQTKIQTTVEHKSLQFLRSKVPQFNRTVRRAGKQSCSSKLQQLPNTSYYQFGSLSKLPFQRTCMHNTTSVCSCSVCVQWPRSISQRRISDDPLTTIFSRAFRQWTDCVCPSSVWTHVPVAKSQIFTVLSPYPAPLTTRFSSNCRLHAGKGTYIHGLCHFLRISSLPLCAHQWTMLVCPWSVNNRHFPLVQFFAVRLYSIWRWRYWAFHPVDERRLLHLRLQSGFHIYVCRPSP